jgi:phospholipase/lecithinase/hemolysin
MASIRRRVIATGFFVLSVLFPVKTFAATFSGIYTFGDSLSDPGNVYNISKQLNSVDPLVPIIPPSPPYFEGRFSNGPNWVDYLSEDLGLNPTTVTALPSGGNPAQGINFAFGGATTGTANTIDPDPRLWGLQQQVGAFTSLLPPTKADPNALYIVWAGANDYLPNGTGFQPFDKPDISLANISAAVTTLAGVGAKNIMVVNLSDLGQIPQTIGTPLSKPLDTLIAAHNAGLSQTINLLSQNLGSDVNLIPLDVKTLADRVTDNPAQFGLTNVTDACLPDIFAPTSCPNPDEYLFWDTKHVTTVGHKLVGDLAFSVLTAKPSERVSEPTSAVAIFAFGVLGTVSVLKRKRHKANLVTQSA